MGKRRPKRPKVRTSAPSAVVRFSPFSHPNSKIEESIRSHSFVGLVEAAYPVSTSTASATEAAEVKGEGNDQGESWFWYKVQGPLWKFLEPDFIASYIRKHGAQLAALSQNASVESGDWDVAAISPDGKLHLAVTKDTYEQLGLIGRASELLAGHRFNICIDLQHPSFVPGRKLHDRVQECLRTQTQPLDFICAHTVNDRCEALVWPPGTTSEQRQVRGQLQRLCGVPLPPIQQCQLAELREDVAAPLGAPIPFEAGFLEELLEWQGLLSCRALGASGEPGAVDGYEWPIPGADGGGGTASSRGNLEIERWEGGLLPPAMVWSQVCAARERVRRGEAPWATVAIWGVRTAPVSWSGQEHGFAFGGVHDDLVVILPGDCYLHFRLKLA